MMDYKDTSFWVTVIGTISTIFAACKGYSLFTEAEITGIAVGISGIIAGVGIVWSKIKLTKLETTLKIANIKRPY